MPTYTYRCNNCEYQFDTRQRMADDPLTDCRNCESEKSLRKVLNSVGIVFKGSGFYVTDSRGKKSAATPSSNGNGSNGDSAKSASNAKQESGSKAEKKLDAGSGKSTTAKTAA